MTHILTKTEIAKIITPIAQQFNVKKICLFGSYATQEATENSDIDLLYQREESDVQGLIMREKFRLALSDALEKDVDLIAIEDLSVSYNQTYRKEVVAGIKSKGELLVG